MEGAVSKQALSRYEKAEMLPGSAILIGLSRALGKPVDYFFMPPFQGEGLKNVKFRKRKTALTGEKEAGAIEKVTYHLERYAELEDVLGISANFENPLVDFPVIDAIQKAEDAAKEVRKQWNLGDDPIHSVYEMLEEKGLKVVEIEEDEGFDGLAALWNGQPIIALNHRFPIERRRFNALHELAHRILTFSEDCEENDEETYCHVFANTMLLPEEALKKALGTRRSYLPASELVVLKEYWGISMAAIVVRAKQSGIISPEYYGTWFKHQKQQGWHKNEPGKYPVEEKAIRFWQLLYSATAEGVISLSHAANLAGKILGEFRKDFENPFNN
jgi:Zn-dependent peptidase ImmA (M78 family)